jgi:signal transduction histidine kinase
VLADPGRIEQVLTNLVENAAKYSPEGGEIRVSVRLDGEQALLEVRDQGIGLPPGAEAILFEPFGRAANATGQNLPGLGLGLYICRQIVEQHGGQIRLDSAGPGLGTTVRLWLPLAQSPVGSPTPTG